ncbi:unnamed protein product [Owenia fusiformis]|uniref:Uncharacterized protein n=1 Tax=Owenia fusiformis TaxID=6347 RepID=A0A8J1T5F7_OWEFU|nr:unnamed protein product [Owenia fusiformis]
MDRDYLNMNGALIDTMDLPASKRTNVSSLQGNMTGGNETLVPVWPYPWIYPADIRLPQVVLISVFVTALMVGIVFGNTLVIIAIMTDRNLKTIQNSFIASLAVADLLVGCMIMPFSLANEMMGYWYFGEYWCELWLAIDVLLCTASILNLCVISLDRYWSITKAIQYLKQRTAKRAAMMIAFVWVLSFIISVPPIIGWKKPQGKIEYWGFPTCELTDDIGYVVYSNVGSFYLPLIVMVGVYVRIYIAARKRSRRGLKKRGPNRGPPPELHKDKSTSTSSSTGTPQVSRNNNKNVFKPPEKIIEGDAMSFGNVDTKTTHVDDHTLRNNADGTRIPQKCEKDDVNKTNQAMAVSAASATSLPTSPLLSKLGDGHEEDTDSTVIANRNRQNSIKVVHIDNKEGSVRRAVLDIPHIEVDDASCELYKHHDGHHNKKHAGLIANIGHFVRKSSITHQRKNSQNDAERQRKRIARAKERRAILVLGIIMGSFIFCWFPFFTTYLICTLMHIPPPGIFKVFFWAGYFNSALNPITYTVFNKDFRNAFKKILLPRRRYM